MTEKRGRGRPAHKPTDEQRKTVSLMVAAGITHEDIANCIGIDSDTMRKHYKEEMTTAAAKANAKIAQTLFNKAINGDTTAAIWWTKSRMNWHETRRQEHVGEDGQPIKTENKIIVEWYDGEEG